MIFDDKHKAKNVKALGLVDLIDCSVKVVFILSIPYLNSMCKYGLNCIKQFVQCANNSK